MYWPVRVSTRMVSPSSTNSGTWTVSPVSSVAGFVPHDPLIVEQELSAASLLELPDDSPAVQAVQEMLRRELEEDA